MLLLFFAYGVTDMREIYRLVRRTAQWADDTTLRRLLYATQQHTTAVRDREDALATLTRCVQQHPAASSSTSRSNNPISAVADLLIRGQFTVGNYPRLPNANVLPHLTSTESKVCYLACPTVRPGATPLTASGGAAVEPPLPPGGAPQPATR